MPACRIDTIRACPIRTNISGIGPLGFANLAFLQFGPRPAAFLVVVDLDYLL